MIAAESANDVSICLEKFHQDYLYDAAGHHVLNTDVGGDNDGTNRAREFSSTLV